LVLGEIVVAAAAVERAIEFVDVAVVVVAGVVVVAAAAVVEDILR
jgi:hypothetical protein